MSSYFCDFFKYKVLDQERLAKFFPFLLWWPKVNGDSIKHDLLAGLTGAIIVLPQGVAFALIAGMPPIYGLYTAMITPIVAALFGSSWHLISGPTTAISIVVFSAISQFAEPFSADFVRLALVLTLIAGVAQFILGLARLGSLINFVSHSVVIGFTAGAALLIGTSQLKHVFGIKIADGASFFGTWAQIFTHLGETNAYIFTIAMVTLAIAILFKWLLPKWPNMLIAMVAGSLLNIALDGQSHGVTVVGEMPAHLPPFAIPDINYETFRLLAPNAFAVALLGLIEAVAIARSIATRTNQRIDGNQEFIGQGLSNIVGSFFSCYAGSGSFTRSGVNYQSGAKTPMSAIFAAVILMLVILLIASYTAYLPIPAMGGIILLVAYNLVDFHHIKRIFKASWQEATVTTLTFLATLFLQLEFAIYVGVLFSLIFYLQRTSKPLIVRLAPDPEHGQRKFKNVKMVDLRECPQLRIIRIDGSLFFGAVENVRNTLQNYTKEGVKNLLIVGNGINMIDVAGAEMLVNEAQRWKSEGGHLFLSSLKYGSRDFFMKGGYAEEFGADHVFASKEDAIAAIYPMLDQEICEECEVRIFRECPPFSNP